MMNEKAFEYCQKDAEMGDTESMDNLGGCYFYVIGVEKDDYKVFIYAKNEAEMGNANAMNNVGINYS